MTGVVGSAASRIVIERGSAWYPPLVEELPRPPQRIYLRGDPGILATESLSIVGSRLATPYGRAATELAARLAVECGITVVSGGAMGCDAIAGEETLRRGGRHVIVLGCGADVVYPRSSEELVERTLASGGAVISLEPWGAPPRRYTFPKRNRVIAALSRATFIAEASLPSGTFSTAEAAVELGREVLAVPGSIFSGLSHGTNHLIASGATCIADEEGLEVAISRIFERLRFCHGPAGDVPGESELERELVRILTASPLRVDDIASHAGLSVRDALEVLGDLTVVGLVERLIDGTYAATSHALHAQTSFRAR